MKRFVSAFLLAAPLVCTLGLAGCTPTDLGLGFVSEEQASQSHSGSGDSESTERQGGPGTEASTDPNERASSYTSAPKLEDKRHLSDGTAYEWDGELIDYRTEWGLFLTSLPTRDALTVLDTLDVEPLASHKGYDREQFGERWVDVDGNGCNTRNDILGRDLTDIQYTSRKYKCIVKSGKLSDPYSGEQIHFKRSDSEAVQIDHIVALFNAWRTGAQEMSELDRIALANDPYNLIAVDGDANYEKSDGDASEWLPADKDFRCEYMARQIGVKARYNLWVTKQEKKVLRSTITKECPGLTLPEYDSIR